MSLIHDPETYERSRRSSSSMAYDGPTNWLITITSSRISEHEYLGEIRDKLIYYPTVTREPFQQRGRQTDLIQRQAVRRHRPAAARPATDRAMICGSQPCSGDLAMLDGFGFPDFAAHRRNRRLRSSNALSSSSKASEPPPIRWPPGPLATVAHSTGGFIDLAHPRSSRLRIITDLWACLFARPSSAPPGMWIAAPCFAATGAGPSPNCHPDSAEVPVAPAQWRRPTGMPAAAWNWPRRPSLRAPGQRALLPRRRKKAAAPSPPPAPWQTADHLDQRRRGSAPPGAARQRQLDSAAAAASACLHLRAGDLLAELPCRSTISAARASCGARGPTATCVVLHDGSWPDRWLATWIPVPITHLSLVPAMLYRLLDLGIRRPPPRCAPC